MSHAVHGFYAVAGHIELVLEKFALQDSVFRVYRSAPVQFFAHLELDDLFGDVAAALAAIINSNIKIEELMQLLFEAFAFSDPHRFGLGHAQGAVTLVELIEVSRQTPLIECFVQKSARSFTGALVEWLEQRLDLLNHQPDEFGVNGRPQGLKQRIHVGTFAEPGVSMAGVLQDQGHIDPFVPQLIGDVLNDPHIGAVTPLSRTGYV